MSTCVNINLPVDRYMSDTRTQILDTAENFIRRGGYNDCSFREIAAEVGIKSASVHHHFPTKQDLAAAVARRYTENFLASLDEKSSNKATPKKEIVRYCGLFRKAFAAGGRACLCGILSSEAALLPELVQLEVIAFTEANVDWLKKIFMVDQPSSVARQKAKFVYSALQGAMGVSALKKDVNWLNDVTDSILSYC
jgi:TetR/AcrR family transcriptional regulator, transcriptional repressor for nem operon